VSSDGSLDQNQDGEPGDVEGSAAIISESNTMKVVDQIDPNAEEGDPNAEESADSVSNSEDEDPEDLYFYLFDDESVVTEFKGPPNEEETEEPDFLYKPQPNHIRVVEFYAHWCPHCAALRPEYNAFAKKMKAIEQEYNIEVDFYAVSCVPHRKLCRELDVHSYPRLKLIVDGDTVEEATDLSSGDLHPFFVLQAIAEQTGKEVSGMLGELEEDEKQNADEETIDRNEATHDNSVFWLPRTKRDIYNDIYLSFYFAMQHGIFVGRDPPDKKARYAFENWIVLLNQVLPPTFRLKALVAEIAEDIDTVLDKEENLSEILDRHPPPKKQWSQSCSRGNSAMGYTCGLWQLFHTMTIGVVEWNLVGSEELSYTPMEVAKILRYYVEHFFGCEVCRVNFMHEYDNCEYGRCDRLITDIGSLEDWKELPLWLFEVHNGVNSRLMAERAERDKRTPTQQDLKGVEWPARTDCPLCWHPDGRFDLDAVYSFLRLTYWPKELISKTIMKEILYATGNAVKSQTNEREKSTKSWVYSLAGFVIASLALSTISLRAQRYIHIQRTGKHKKMDDDFI